MHLDLLSMPQSGGKNVKTFRWDQELKTQNLFVAFKRSRSPPCADLRFQSFSSILYSTRKACLLVERLVRGYTKFDFTVDEGKGRLNPSRDKN